VAYRETITRSFTADTTLKRQSGGSGMYARVVVEFSPMTDEERAEAKGNELVYTNDIRGGSITNEFARAAEKGMREAMEGGVIAGYPVVNIRARLIDGAMHDVDSNEMAFKIAGSMCFKEAFAAARRSFWNRR
jgi:elongation factor G